MKKGVMDLTMKTMFAVIILIVVFFVLFTTFSSSFGVAEQKGAIASEEHARNILQSAMSSNCFAVTDQILLPSGIFDADKLTYNDNSDLGCINSFDILYSLIFRDSKTGAEWIVGPQNDIDSAEILSITQPASIMYESSNVHGGSITINAYFSNEVSLYGAIKQACQFEESTTYVAITNLDVSYDQSDNKFFIGNSNFYAGFSCDVNDFELKPGRNAIVFKRQGGGLKLLT